MKTQYYIISTKVKLNRGVMERKEIDLAWKKICRYVKELNRSDYSKADAYLSQLFPQAMSEGYLVLSANTHFIKCKVEEFYLEDIERAFNKITNTSGVVVIEDIEGSDEEHKSTSVSLGTNRAKEALAAEINKKVAKYYGVRDIDLMGETRVSHIVKARQVAQYLCREIAGLSYPAIGSVFKKDHSSVMHSIKVVERYMAESSEFSEEITNLLEYKMTKPNLLGKKFYRLKVKAQAGSDGKNRLWLCECSCGKHVEVATHLLTSGKKKSCGCLLEEQYKRNDIKPNQKFGMLTTIRKAEKNKYGATQWECKCECGETTKITSSNLRAGIKSCGCQQGKGKRKKKPIDRTGQKLGKLTIQCEAERDNEGHRQWLCICECGNKVTIPEKHASPIHGRKSCGCSSKGKYGGESKKTHPNNKLYKVHKALIARCYNPNVKAYKTHGAKGITVCAEWHEWEVFKRWAFDSGYVQGKQLCRINYENGFNPENCLWLTKSESITKRSKDSAPKFAYKGEVHTWSEWSEITGLSCHILSQRKGQGWPMERILTTPVGTNTRRRFMTLNGETRSLSEWSQILGIPRNTICNRLKRGWTEEQALSEPVAKRANEKSTYLLGCHIDYPPSIVRATLRIDKNLRLHDDSYNEINRRVSILFDSIKLIERIDGINYYWCKNELQVKTLSGRELLELELEHAIEQDLLDTVAIREHNKKKK